MNVVNILAIESSCDETSVAIVQNGKTVLAHVIASQINSHKRFGGVVPEIASRHHIEQIIAVIDEAFNQCHLTMANIDAVAVTHGPGLVGSLLIGITAAKTLAFAHSKPLIAVNHMAGHIYASQLAHDLSFPLIALLVSGGHTELVYMPKENTYTLIGETRDDAVGEAYDKVGRILNLPYPGGKAIDELAHVGKATIDLPRAMINEDNYDFSFSGIKSAVINTVHNAKQKGLIIAPEDLAASFQSCVIDVLVEKTIRSMKAYRVNQLIVAGGVAANKGLRQALQEAVYRLDYRVELIFPPLALCGDNAAMIGAAAYPLFLEKQFVEWDLNAIAALSL